jgi:hypothetical protein
MMAITASSPILMMNYGVSDRPAPDPSRGGHLVGFQVGDPVEVTASTTSPSAAPAALLAGVARLWHAFVRCFDGW